MLLFVKNICLIFTAFVMWESCATPN